MRRDLFDDEHEQYRESVRAFIAQEVVPNYADWERAGIVPRDLFTQLADLGALSFGVPEEYGGSGVDDFRYNVILAEEGSRAHVQPAVHRAESGRRHRDAVPAGAWATTSRRPAGCPGIVAGETITAIAMTEPGTGSDLSGIQTRAVRDGDDWIVDGAKTFITNGINADLVVVAVRTGEHRHQRPQPAGARARNARIRARAQARQDRACTRRTPPSSRSPASACPRRTCSARRATGSPA